MANKTNVRLAETEIQEIRGRLRKVGRGQWERVGGTFVWSDKMGHIALCEKSDYTEFIAHARTDIPKLLREVEALRNEIAELRRRNDAE